MFRIEESRRERLARIALPAAIALLLLLTLGALGAVVLFQVRDERALVAALVLALGAALAFATGWRAYARTERRLRELKIFAADVLESVPTGVVTLDLEGHVTAVNGRAAALLGIDPRRTRLPYDQVFARAPILCDAAERLLERRQPFRNLDIAAPGGGGNGGEPQRTLLLEGSFLETVGGERIGAVIQVTDVTEQRQVEREVRRAEQLATLGTLAASVAHEIRNPLAALDINVQLLREAMAAGRTGAETERYGKVIDSELRRLDGIVENFIRFARSSPLERAPVALGKLAEETLALVAPECRSHKVALERQGLDAPHPSVLAAEGELKQALLNVVLNAIQAMPAGGALTVSLEHGPAQARLAVRDTGPGIPARIRERVFDLFFTTREGGTGLGLPIAKKIVAAHGGDIVFETGEGGTTFTIVLPLHAPVAEARC